MTETPGEQVQRLQYSLVSLQDEHAKNLRNFYKEIRQLQDSHADLTTKVADAATKNIDYKTNCAKQQTIKRKLTDKKGDIEAVKNLIATCDERLSVLESEQRIKDEEYKVHVKMTSNKVDELENEVKKESERIACLTNKLRSDRLKEKQPLIPATDDNKNYESIFVSALPAPSSVSSNNKRRGSLQSISQHCPDINNPNKSVFPATLKNPGFGGASSSHLFRRGSESKGRKERRLSLALPLKKQDSCLLPLGKKTKRSFSVDTPEVTVIKPLPPIAPPSGGGAKDPRKLRYSKLINKNEKILIKK